MLSRLILIFYLTTYLVASDPYCFCNKLRNRRQEEKALAEDGTLIPAFLESVLRELETLYSTRAASDPRFPFLTLVSYTHGGSAAGIGHQRLKTGSITDDNIQRRMVFTLTHQGQEYQPDLLYLYIWKMGMQARKNFGLHFTTIRRGPEFVETEKALKKMFKERSKQGSRDVPHSLLWESDGLKEVREEHIFDQYHTEVFTHDACAHFYIFMNKVIREYLGISSYKVVNQVSPMGMLFGEKKGACIESGKPELELMSNSEFRETLATDNSEDISKSNDRLLDKRDTKVDFTYSTLSVNSKEGNSEPGVMDDPTIDFDNLLDDPELQSSFTVPLKEEQLYYQTTDQLSSQPIHSGPLVNFEPADETPTKSSDKLSPKGSISPNKNKPVNQKISNLKPVSTPRLKSKSKLTPVAKDTPSKIPLLVKKPSLTRPSGAKRIVRVVEPTPRTGPKKNGTPKADPKSSKLSTPSKENSRRNPQKDKPESTLKDNQKPNQKRVDIPSTPSKKDIGQKSSKLVVEVPNTKYKPKNLLPKRNPQPQKGHPQKMELEDFSNKEPQQDTEENLLRDPVFDELNTSISSIGESPNLNESFMPTNEMQQLHDHLSPNNEVEEDPLLRYLNPSADPKRQKDDGTRAGEDTPTKQKTRKETLEELLWDDSEDKSADPNEARIGDPNETNLLGTDEALEETGLTDFDDNLLDDPEPMEEEEEKSEENLLDQEDPTPEYHMSPDDERRFLNVVLKTNQIVLTESEQTLFLTRVKYLWQGSLRKPSEIIRDYELIMTSGIFVEDDPEKNVFAAKGSVSMVTELYRLEHPGNPVYYHLNPPTPSFDQIRDFETRRRFLENFLAVVSQLSDLDADARAALGLPATYNFKIFTDLTIWFDPVTSIKTFLMVLLAHYEFELTHVLKVEEYIDEREVYVKINFEYDRSRQRVACQADTKNLQLLPVERIPKIVESAYDQFLASNKKSKDWKIVSTCVKDITKDLKDAALKGAMADFKI